VADEDRRGEMYDGDVCARPELTMEMRASAATRSRMVYKTIVISGHWDEFGRRENRGRSRGDLRQG